MAYLSKTPNLTKTDLISQDRTKCMATNSQSLRTRRVLWSRCLSLERPTSIANCKRRHSMLTNSAKIRAFWPKLTNRRTKKKFSQRVDRRRAPTSSPYQLCKIGAPCQSRSASCGTIENLTSLKESNFSAISSGSFALRQSS